MEQLLMLGPYLLTPAVRIRVKHPERPSQVLHGWWALPGGRVVEYRKLRDLANRMG